MENPTNFQLHKPYKNLVVIHPEGYQEVSGKMANTQQGYVKIVERKIRYEMMRIIEG